MSEPSLRQKREVEEHDGNHTTGDEKRLQALRAYVGNIPRDHRGVLVTEIDESITDLHTRWSARDPYWSIAAHPLSQPKRSTWSTAWLSVTIVSSSSSIARIQ